MKIGLVTTWREKCGIAEYASNMVKSMSSSKYQFQIINRPFAPSQIVAEAYDCDIIHFNFEPGLMGHIGDDVIRSLKAMGKKTVLTLHTTHEGDNRNAFTDSFNQVIVHEQTTDGFKVIPHGAEEVSFSGLVNLEKEPKNVIGTAGFPFPWKGFHEVALTAEMLGMGVLVIAPETNHIDTWVMEKCIKGACTNVEYVTDYLPTEEVINKLHECKVNVFNYHGGNYGISGAVRLGISAQRPLVISRSRQFRDLFSYEPEITVADNTSPEAVKAAVELALENNRIPETALNNMKWSRVSRDIESVYERLMIR